jgi:hypothetical protein
MFDQKYEDRLKAWSCLRQELETADDPFQLVIDHYKQSPRCNIHTDPWDNSIWPTPWELIDENQYCEFCIVLGMCYSLQLTDRFNESKFEIHIGIDDEESRTCYLLIIDDSTVFGWDETYIKKEDLPKSYRSQMIYEMPAIQ